MNISSNERFHELAHKALAKEASPAEHRELKALIAENPKLKEEIEQMGGEAVVLRELLPLLEELQHPVPNIPAPPMERLGREVGGVFRARAKSKGDLRELLGKLEDWAHRQADASREEVAALVALLRGSLLEEECDAAPAEMMMLRSPEIGYPAPRLREKVAERAREEAAQRQREMERRLLSLEGRIREAEEITRKCRDEMRGLLEAFARDRDAGVERRGQNPKVAQPE